MITPVLYITIPDSLIIKGINIEVESNVGVNILIDKIDIDLPHIFQFVKRINYQFIFSLHSSVFSCTDISKLFPHLYTLFTLSDSFNKSKSRIPIFFDIQSEKLLNPQPLKDYFSKQGEENVEFVMINPAINSVVNSIFFTERKQLEMFDEEQLISLSTHNINQIILLVTNMELTETHTSFVNDLRKQNRHAAMFFETITLQITNNNLEHQFYLWQYRCALYFSFISLSKKVGEAQYYDILKWYESEYEVLPVWYKRFGHIIKVVKGKRSFKSLFTNERAKK